MDHDSLMIANRSHSDSLAFSPPALKDKFTQNLSFNISRYLLTRLALMQPFVEPHSETT